MLFKFDTTIVCLVLIVIHLLIVLAKLQDSDFTARTVNALLLIGPTIRLLLIIVLEGQFDNVEGGTLAVFFHEVDLSSVASNGLDLTQLRLDS